MQLGHVADLRGHGLIHLGVSRVGPCALDDGRVAENLGVPRHRLYNVLNSGTVHGLLHATYELSVTLLLQLLAEDVLANLHE